MSRSYKGKTIKTDIVPVKTAQHFLDAVKGYKTTYTGSQRRDNRTSFSTILTTAVKAQLITPHELKTVFGITKDQVELARRGKGADVPKETRNALIAHLEPKAAEMLVARM